MSFDFLQASCGLCISFLSRHSTFCVYFLIFLFYLVDFQTTARLGFLFHTFMLMIY